ncbi:MAG: protein kinase [Verrucomicrobia bacterium]|nr:protein kinase [Verrucomicrobiota bacterium]MCG2681102.1 protein kinase [Kiritimatiellia bacterium]MBU4248211.1 protein kinase [Verrucomicrobiota bacterium]MBU4292325.1 protein kinase [Verrucomicrobiota bacterium]MBU4428624.1 protein kinase [Verrucomicrobiota bacterium]
MDTPQFPGFEIIETMPRGGMSTVYKARQIYLDRVVALKTLPLTLAAESADINQFLAEARITANLKHPNIVQVYDFGKTEEGIYYFVMEFISGYSLGDWIRRKQFLAEDNSLLVAQSVSEALGYAWKTASVVHCDIKPDNVIIDGDGTVKVADLGLAKSVRSVVDHAKLASGGVFGTPNYISPEQSRGDADLDCRADIYSLGATLYHCMTGKMPFEGVPALAAMDMQITDQIPDAQDVNPLLSTEAACLIEKMMAKDRQYRQADWDAVLVDVNRVMSRQVPLGAMPSKGASTMRQSALRGARPQVKALVSPPVPIVSGEKSSDSTAFRNMERQFALKQKQKTGIRPEWWFAALITLAVVVLGILVVRSLWRGGHSPVIEVTEPPALVSPEEASQAVSETQDQPVDAIALENNAREMFEFAQKWAETNPSRINDAIRQYEKVANETGGTKYSLMATAEIQKLQAVKQKAADSVMEALNTRAIPMIAKSEFAQAADFYEQYQGEWAAETAESRGTKIRELRERGRVFRERQQKSAEEAGQQWRQLLDRVGARLVDGDIQAALAQASQGAAMPMLVSRKKEINNLVTLLTQASLMDQRILNAFRALKDQEATVVLTNGVEKVTIRDIQDNMIQVEKIVVVGAGQASQPKSFRVDDLALSEKRLRLGSEDNPETALMQGLLSIREPDWESAESYFARTGPLLAPVLAVKLGEKKNIHTEEQAKRVLLGIMRNVLLDVAKDNPTCEDCLAAIRRRNYSAKDAQGLAKAVDAYRAIYGQTRYAKQYEPVLSALAHVPVTKGGERESVPQPSAPAKPVILPPQVKSPVKPSTPEAVKAQLLERNPGIMEEAIVFVPDNSGKIIRVEIFSEGVNDIRPLAALPDVREILCGGALAWGQDSIAPLADLSPLRGLPLRELDVSRTMVKDITPLFGMRLNKLKLASTKIIDISYLKGMPLNELDVEGTRIRDISALREMPLKRLNLTDTDVMDLTPLKGISLERLNIARTKVRDLSPLIGMPLRALDISGLDIKDLSLLKNFPLKELSVAQSKIRDFSYLTGLNLEKLSLADTGIKDLSILQGMSLRELSLQGTRVRDLTSLQGLPLVTLDLRITEVKDLTPIKALPLKYLAIAHTQVKDITPIQDMPIESIWLDFNIHQPGDRYWIAAVLRRMPKLREVNGQPWGGGGLHRRSR